MFGVNPEGCDEPDRNWKFSLADVRERGFWKDYVKAYQDCLRATGTHHAPWYVVPADDKENARLIVSQIVLDALNGQEAFAGVGGESEAALTRMRDN